jgi:hypothetical protein
MRGSGGATSMSEGREGKGLGAAGEGDSCGTELSNEGSGIYKE